jgi:hypothetical protein
MRGPGSTSFVLAPVWLVAGPGPGRAGQKMLDLAKRFLAGQTKANSKSDESTQQRNARNGCFALSKIGSKVATGASLNKALLPPDRLPTIQNQKHPTQYLHGLLKP